jgi:hypothetical protein
MSDRGAAAPATYDIGIGICTSVAATGVSVSLDSSVVSRLVPGQPWRRSGTSLLRFHPDLCSPRRPPEPGIEIYLARDRIGRNPTAVLDLDGDGRTCEVDLNVLLQGLDPDPTPPPATGRSARR